MKKAIYIAGLILFMQSCTKPEVVVNQSPSNTPLTSKLILFEIDYQSNEFIGAKEMSFLAQSMGNIPLTPYYTPSTEIMNGEYTLKYEPGLTDDTDVDVFKARIVHDGVGEVLIPNEMILSEFLEVTGDSLEIVTVPEDGDTYNNVIKFKSDSELLFGLDNTSNVEGITSCLSHLQLMKDYLTKADQTISGRQFGLLLYKPGVEADDDSDWRWYFLAFY